MQRMRGESEFATALGGRLKDHFRLHGGLCDLSLGEWLEYELFRPGL